MRKILRFTFIPILLLAAVSGVIACSSTPTPTSTTPNVAAIRAYADPATETALQGLSEHNLAKYTQYANSEFKAAVTQEIRDNTAAQINSQLGSFVSIEFLRTEEQDGYTIVYYKAKYSRGEVGIRMVFDKDHLVAGQWFE
ncbi:MAG: DUF3887 domain-containing protein [Chloroflexota bacterium]|nr:DUF3887 domain-containing protein [Chloroflexota bacterium]